MAKDDKAHTTYAIVTALLHLPQGASGKVIFIYDNTWIEGLELPWNSQGYIYSSMDDAIPTEIHWLSIANSIVIVLVLSAMIGAIMVRNLQNNFQ